VVSSNGSIRGVIFDLDGTLVDSGLDFDRMREEMQLPPGTPVLEALATLDASRAADCRTILERHEREGVARARLMPGVATLRAALADRGIRQAVVTRNSRHLAQATLERVGQPFEIVLGREDGPVKPDPAALCRICQIWQLPVEAVAMIGDYRFDLEAGRRAGVRTALYTAGRDLRSFDYAHLADHFVECFSRAEALLDWLAAPTHPSGLAKTGGP
jgi:phosphoglycolate phosphatase